ncbi:MAG: glycosyltransferase [Bacteroidales bacterium]|nr:glycosyltransferase [Bacteroidales bacterium]
MIVLCIIATLYVLLMWALWVGLGRVLAQPKPAEPPADAGISVVVVFRNEVHNLPALLGALRAQTLPQHRWEALFIDDGSTDGGPAMVEAAGDGVALLRLPPRGKKPALAEGLARTRFGTVALCDADCIPPPTWLAELLRWSHGVALLQGAVLVQPTGHWAAPLDALDYASLQAAAAGAFGLGRPIMAASANLTVGPAAVPSAHHLRPDIDTGDDVFILHRAKRMGLSMRCSLSPLMAMRTRFDGGVRQRLARRMRWASKATAYTDADSVVVALLVALFNLSIALAVPASACGLLPVGTAPALWAAKLLADTPLMLRYLRATGQRNLLPYYLPLQILYPFYTTAEAVGALIRSKKRKMKRGSNGIFINFGAWKG